MLLKHLILFICLSIYSTKCDYISADEPECRLNWINLAIKIVRLIIFVIFREDCLKLNETLQTECLNQMMQFYSYKYIKSVFNFGKSAIYAGLWATRFVSSVKLTKHHKTLFTFQLRLIKTRFYGNLLLFIITECLFVIGKAWARLIRKSVQKNFSQIQQFSALRRCKLRRVERSLARHIRLVSKLLTQKRRPRREIQNTVRVHTLVAVSHSMQLRSSHVENSLLHIFIHIYSSSSYN